MATKKSVKKATAKKSVKKAAAKKSVKKVASVPDAPVAGQTKPVVPMPQIPAYGYAQPSQPKPVQVTVPVPHWTDALVKIGACHGDALQWAKTQKDLQTAWENCDRTDWMMWLLDRICKNQVSYDVRQRLQFELDWMSREFSKRFQSHVNPGNPSNIRSRHVRNWTDEDRALLGDFIRFYFPTPAPQVRTYGQK